MTQDDIIRAALTRVMARTGLSVNAWSEKAGMKEGTLRAFMSRRTRSITVETLEKLAAAVGLAVPDILRSQIPLVGIVGAGEQIFPFDDAAMGAGLDMVDAPPGCPADSVAVEVRGDSMFPAYWSGDVLIYRRDGPVDPVRCLYNECVVKVADGPTLVKRLMPGRQPGRYTLESYNAPPLLDQVVEWAAPVAWVDKSRRGQKG